MTESGLVTLIDYVAGILMKVCGLHSVDTVAVFVFARRTKRDSQQYAHAVSRPKIVWIASRDFLWREPIRSYRMAGCT